MTEIDFHPSKFLIHAADVESARELIRRMLVLDKHLTWIKIGKKTLAHVRDAFKLALEYGLWNGSVFFDQKHHDIPKIVRGACKADAEMGAGMTTVHCSGGPDMLRAAVEGAGEGGDSNCLVLGVTVLTSLDEPSWQDMMGTRRTIEEQVLYFVEMGVEAGVTGFVCSAKEAPAIREQFPNVTLVTPGIRLPSSDVEDQKRVVTPADAIAGGSDYLVVGSDISNAIESGGLIPRLEEYFMMMETGYRRTR